MTHVRSILTRDEAEAVVRFFEAYREWDVLFNARNSKAGDRAAARAELSMAFCRAEQGGAVEAIEARAKGEVLNV